MLTVNLNFPDPITEDKCFYGRDEVWNQVQRNLLGPNSRPVILLGERQLGKTSLLQISIQRIETLPESHLIPVVLPPGSTLSSYESLAVSLVKNLQMAVMNILSSSAVQDLKQPQKLGSNQELIDLLYDLVQQVDGKEFVFCLDDLDSLLQPLIHEGLEDEIQKIVGLIDNLIWGRHRLRINFFITLSKIPEVLRNPYATNRILASSRLVELPPFTIAETGEMIHGLLKPHVKITGKAVNRFYLYTGGIPYLIKLLLDTLLQCDEFIQNPIIITPNWIDHVNKLAATDYGYSLIFQNIFERNFSIQERALTLLMTRADRPINTNELILLGSQFITATNSLVRKSYLSEDEQGFSWRILFFPEWLRHWDRYEEEMALLDVPKLMDTLSIDIWIDKTTKKVFYKQDPVQLSSRQYDVLECLCIHKGKLVSYDQIASHLWHVDEEWENFSLGAITMAVSRLRKKFKTETRIPPYIETVAGQGYILHHAGFLPEHTRF